MTALSISYSFHSFWGFTVLLGNLFLLIRRKPALYASILLHAVFLVAGVSFIVYLLLNMEDYRTFAWRLGSLGFYTGYAIYSLSIFCSKRFKSALFQSSQEPEEKPGWICSKCLAKNLFSINCWSCQTPKPADNSQTLRQETGKLDVYLQKQKETGKLDHDKI